MTLGTSLLLFGMSLYTLVTVSGCFGFECLVKNGFCIMRVEECRHNKEILKYLLCVYGHVYPKSNKDIEKVNVVDT